VGDKEIKYFLSGTKILAQTDGTNTLYFYYGADGVTGFTFNNEDYYYKKNAQNDIISIYSTNGDELVKYFYDAWGNHIAEIVDTNENMSYTDNVQKIETLARLNPFRYRSYIYDEETNLYYLNSRYYDPETARFINADDLAYLDQYSFNGLNLFVYCLNNPIMMTDENGYGWLSDAWKKFTNFVKNSWEVIVGSIVSVGLVIGGLALTIFSVGALTSVGATLIGAGVGGFIGGLQSQANGGSYWAGYLGGAISGGLTGLGVSLGPVGAFILGAAGNFTGTIVTDSINGVTINKNYIADLLANSLVSGLISIGASYFGKATEILNILGWNDIFAGITVWAEFAFSWVTDKTKELFYAITSEIRKFFN
jgi:RHS repeat-associated protein